MKKILILALVIALMFVPVVLASAPVVIHVDPSGLPPAVDPFDPLCGCACDSGPIVVIDNPTQGQLLVRCGCE